MGSGYLKLFVKLVFIWKETIKAPKKKKFILKMRDSEIFNVFWGWRRGWR